LNRIHDEHEHRCVACGYSLYGLSDEPRCPECGLLNVPAEYRRQVWELVDSGKWFFSGFFHPFRKRLPGWWWSLDRPGDVRQSFKALGRNLLATAIIVLASGAVIEACRIEVRTFFAYTDTDGTRIEKPNYLTVLGLMGAHRENGYFEVDTEVWLPSTAPTWRTTTNLAVKASWKFIPECVVIIVFLIGSWLGPTSVGLITQIRKGLPAFAHAPRTILAAANLESHRLIYSACVVVGACTLERYFCLKLYANRFALYEGLQTGMFWACLAFAAIGWIGPLRSDYTRQLVRSRLHAARILVMYALLFPFAVLGLAIGVMILIAWLFGHE